jgi:sarcosine oxidase gamma subunit
MASTLVGCEGPSGQPSEQPCTLIVHSITGGDVSVMEEDKGGWIEAQVGMSLEPGDSIKCSGSSNAEITFIEGTTIELETGTEIEVASLDYSADTDSATIRLKQTIGSIIFRVTKIIDPASLYEIETPTGVVAIRGSIVQVSVIEDGTTWVCNLEGDIWAIAQGVERQIPEGRCCIIRPDELPELINDAPTDISLDSSSIAENQPSGTAVGNFSSTDPDIGDTFTYSLASGEGDDDNASFTIAGSQLQTGASFDYETKNSYSIRVRSTDQGGLWVEKQFTITVTSLNEKPVASASSNSPVCEDDTIQLYGGPNGMAAYLWTGPGGWTSSLQNPTRTGATKAMAGDYTLTVTSSDGCTDDESTSVKVNAKPTATASSNSPVCEGDTIQLYGGPNGMEKYVWTGPDGWTSSLQNPTRTGATRAMTGTYTLTVTNSNGCTDYESTWVKVWNLSVTASSNSPVCEGETIFFYGGPDGMATYAWTGPGGWTSSRQNPTRGATAATAGKYTLTVTLAGCTDYESINVKVYARPTAAASSNSPVSENSTLKLYGGPDGMATYSWQGPDGWTSSLQNPGRPNVTQAMAGRYYLRVTNSDGCYDKAATDVVITSG